MDAGFLTDDFLLSSETACTALPRGRRARSDRRSSQPPLPRRHRRRSCLRDAGRPLARRRPLQVASHAPRGVRGASHHGGRGSVGKVLCLGGHRPPPDPQPAVCLVAPRASPGVRDRSRAQPLDGARDLGGGEPSAARLDGAEAPFPFRRPRYRDYRRSGRRPRGAPEPHREARDDDPDVPPRRRAPPARRSAGLERLDRPPGGGNGDNDRRSALTARRAHRLVRALCGAGWACERPRPRVPARLSP